MRKRPVVLLGGSGFIGTALARAFARGGYPVRIVSRRAPPKQAGVRWHRGSIGDRKAVAPAVRGAGCIFHLACDSRPGTANGPFEEARDNLLPGLRLLPWLPRDARLVFVSSGGAIYGEPARARAHEGDPVAPLSNYAAGKAALEAFLAAHAHLQQRDVVLLRPSNLYGPGQRLADGFGVVPALLGAAASGRRFISFGDGKAVRDYLYIDDFVSLCLALARGPVRAGVRTYNAGSSRGRSLNALIAAVEHVTGRVLRRERRPARRGDVRRIVLDTRRARRELGWAPAVSLEQGLRRTWRGSTDSPR